MAKTVRKGKHAVVTFEDQGLEKLRQDLAMLKKLKIRVGYQPPEGKDRYEEGISVAKLAAVMEFGGEDLPARSFIRSTIFEQQSAIVRVEEQQIARVIEGKATPVEAMSEIGSFVVGLIRAKLESAASWAAPLDPDTIEEKGSATPLSDTQRLSRSLSWRVSIGRQEFARGNR